MESKQSTFLANMQKAIAKLLILQLLSKRPMYIAEILELIKQGTKATCTYNNLYRAIYRLEEDSFIKMDGKSSVSERSRIYYNITEKGSCELNILLSEYRSFVEEINCFFVSSDSL